MGSVVGALDDEADCSTAVPSTERIHGLEAFLRSPDSESPFSPPVPAGDDGALIDAANEPTNLVAAKVQAPIDAANEPTNLIASKLGQSVATVDRIASEPCNLIALSLPSSRVPIGATSCSFLNSTGNDSINGLGQAALEIPPSVFPVRSDRPTFDLPQWKVRDAKGCCAKFGCHRAWRYACSFCKLRTCKAHFKQRGGFVECWHCLASSK